MDLVCVSVGEKWWLIWDKYSNAVKCVEHFWLLRFYSVDVRVTLSLEWCLLVWSPGSKTSTAMNAPLRRIMPTIIFTNSPSMSVTHVGRNYRDHWFSWPPGTPRDAVLCQGGTTSNTGFTTICTPLPRVIPKVICTFFHPWCTSLASENIAMIDLADHQMIQNAPTALYTFAALK